MRLKNKPWAKPFIDAHPTIVFSKNIEDILVPIRPKFHSLHLEIGCGKGDFLVQQALRHPTHLYIGVEKALTAIAIAGKKVAEQGLENVKLIFNDFVHIADVLSSFPVASIFLNFSDPWPKLRHHKRRLTAETMIALYSKILVPTGMIYVKTDNLDLLQFSKKNFEKQGYDILDYDEDYRLLDPEDSITEYEKDFREKGVKIKRLIARKHR